jgi:hypothetical protein
MKKTNSRAILLILGITICAFFASGFKVDPSDNTIYLPVIQQNMPCPTIVGFGAQHCPYPPACVLPDWAGLNFNGASYLQPPSLIVWYNDVLVDIFTSGVYQWATLQMTGFQFDPAGQPDGLILRAQANFTNGCTATSELVFPGAAP